MAMDPKTSRFPGFDFAHRTYGRSLMVHADCFHWLRQVPDNSIAAVVTDPPYGIREYEVEELAQRRCGRTGIWRIPPSFDGNKRAPLPRFTALDHQERQTLRHFFHEWATVLLPKLKPGAHVFVACNAFMSPLVCSSLMEGGLEFRAQIIRLIRTLRGGDRPKLGEQEFPDVCSLPRGSYEPWGLFRKPLPKGTTLRECLRDHGTGGLRRRMDGKPFLDVIPSERTPRRERLIANHPSLKPQSLMRQLVWSALPLGEGVVVDPFMGSGSTVAAAEAVGYRSVGVERYSDYYELAGEAVPRLHALPINGLSSPPPSHNGQAQLELGAGVPVNPVVHHLGVTAAVDAGCDRAPTGG
ncbi:DNA methylase [Candidatus Synechococcus spongiarum LMB bulk15N]|uniref:Methyltransferase n=2 Tax=Candidatus Synechococcus spongiarum TaxID=431041 RepID=A0A1T1D4H6_9SYNE|nr:DNA methylase [Candidatus Synechococcus spongiarum LMB bulk15N]